uniref:Uncharacterized protein n=1 Tax=Trypanosoma congolense (strain IL3000) TaxID=1068625 RepID=G0URR4_TRYCI|nr:hypothetical protein, unlikely [Trypanosoma congolense IL3000]
MESGWRNAVCFFFSKNKVKNRTYHLHKHINNKKKMERKNCRKEVETYVLHVHAYPHAGVCGCKYEHQPLISAPERPSKSEEKKTQHTLRAIFLALNPNAKGFKKVQGAA